MKERIQKILASRGICSRRKAEQLIAAGRVSCNGIVCAVGDSADPQIDEILLDGKTLPPQSDHVYIMLNKPRGYVTTLSDEKGRKNVCELVADCKTRVYPVGRLDMDSEGLLLFTNDGDFANRMMHPKHEIDKTYRVNVIGFSDVGLQQLKMPITLDGYMIREPKVSVVKGKQDSSGKAELLITIHEGRNRQVRRMCDAAGMRVQRLVRISEDGLQLGDLRVGSWRYLSEDEIATLK